MPGLHDIKKQISSIKSTQQITSAMELVAASKLRRAQERATGARPYSNGLESLLHRLMESGVRLDDKLLENGKEGPVCYILITADRGLAGGYNSNLLKAFSSDLSDHPSEYGVKVIAVGSKGRDFCRKQGISMTGGYSFADDVQYMLASKVTSDAVQLFLSGQVSEVRVVYTRFLSTVAQKPTVYTLLPVKPEEPKKVDGEKIPTVPYILEPSPSHLLNTLLPKYIAVQVHHSLLESKASELGAKMVAMGAATDNAEELIDDLSLKFNRQRQAAITREISEIVGGANALK